MGYLKIVEVGQWKAKNTKLFKSILTSTDYLSLKGQRQEMLRGDLGREGCLTRKVPFFLRMQPCKPKTKQETWK